MSIGALEQRLTIEQEVQTPDGAGGYALGWATVASVWGLIEPLGGRERLAAAHLQAGTTHRVTIRKLAGITAAMRIKAGGRLFNIRVVQSSGPRDPFFDLICEEGVAK